MKSQLQPKTHQRMAQISALVLALFCSGLYYQQHHRSTAAVVPPNKKIKLQPYKNWGLINNKKSSHIHALEAWNIIRGDRKILVAVIDTGIDYNHKDLRSNLWKHKLPIDNQWKKRIVGFGRKLLGRKKQPSYRIQNSKSFIYGWDFVNNSPNPRDHHGHGTHVAGIIGAVSNLKAGISGVAQKVSIMAIKYYSELNSGTVNLNNTIKAIEYAIQKGARIINYSGGGPEFSEAEYLAIKKSRSKRCLICICSRKRTSRYRFCEPLLLSFGLWTFQYYFSSCH